jgi:hypothetical protein
MEEGSLRTVGGSTLNEGRLEVYINGEWGTVCNDNWGSRDALVACRQLGYSGMSSYHISIPSGPSSQRIWLDHVECSGSESKLINCNHRGYGVHNCSHSEDVGIRCQGIQVRLIGGSTSSEGHVEVYYSEQWLSVCGTSFSYQSEEAATICSHLGFNSVIRSKTYYRSSSGSTTADISCSGSQPSLNLCSIRNVLCSSSLRHYVECSNSNSSSQYRTA